MPTSMCLFSARSKSEGCPSSNVVSRKMVFMLLQLLGCQLLLHVCTVNSIVNVDPTVNSGDLVTVENSTNTPVTSFRDWQYIYLRFNTSGFGITIYDLRACDNADCSSYNIQLIDVNGCPTVHSGVGTIIPSGFVRNSVESQLYETQSFQMFRWDNGNSMYFKGKKSVCETDTAECSDKCTAHTTGRRRREAVSDPPYIPPRGSYLITGANGKLCNITFSDSISGYEQSEHDAVFGQADKTSLTSNGLEYGLFTLAYQIYFLCDIEERAVFLTISLLGLLTVISSLTAITLTYQIQVLYKRGEV